MKYFSPLFNILLTWERQAPPPPVFSLFLFRRPCVASSASSAYVLAAAASVLKSPLGIQTLARADRLFIRWATCLANMSCWVGRFDCVPSRVDTLRLHACQHSISAVSTCEADMINWRRAMPTSERMSCSSMNSRENRSKRHGVSLWRSHISSATCLDCVAKKSLKGGMRCIHAKNTAHTLHLPSSSFGMRGKRIARSDSSPAPPRKRLEC